MGAVQIHDSSSLGPCENEGLVNNGGGSISHTLHRSEAQQTVIDKKAEH